MPTNSTRPASRCARSEAISASIVLISALRISSSWRRWVRSSFSFS